MDRKTQEQSAEGAFDFISVVDSHLVEVRHALHRSLQVVVSHPAGLECVGVSPTCA